MYELGIRQTDKNLKLSLMHFYIFKRHTIVFTLDSKKLTDNHKMAHVVKKICKQLTNLHKI